MVEPTPRATSPIHFHLPDFTVFTVASSPASLLLPSSPASPAPSWRGCCPEPGAEENARAWTGRRSAVAAAAKAPEGRCGGGKIEQEVTKRCDGRPRAEAAASRQRRIWLMQVCVANILAHADMTLFGCEFACTRSICHHSLHANPLPPPPPPPPPPPLPPPLPPLPPRRLLPSTRHITRQALDGFRSIYYNFSVFFV
jgi:hypothetical protein